MTEAIAAAAKALLKKLAVDLALDKDKRNKFLLIVGSIVVGLIFLLMTPVVVLSSIGDSEPFPEMKGNIIYIDYELSSWKYLHIKKTYPPDLTNFSNHAKIVKKNGYICKGGGNAFGGEWKPKDKNSERFLGKPNTIKENTVTTTKGNYRVKNYYDKNGKAVAERHLTDHNQPAHHTNPHDHNIDWSKNVPAMGDRTNYLNSEAPSFIEFLEGLLGDISEIITGEEKSMDKKYVNPDYNPDDYKFETLGEFKCYLASGWNVGFEYNGIEYGVEAIFDESTGKKIEDYYDIWIYNKGDIANSLSLEEVLDYKLDGVKIRDLILTAEITERVM